MSPTNTRTYRVRTQSGIWGWRSRLRTQYSGFPEFNRNNQYFNLAARLSYETATDAWLANPVIEGSTNPSDYRRVSA